MSFNEHSPKICSVNGLHGVNESFRGLVPGSSVVIIGFYMPTQSPGFSTLHLDVRRIVLKISAETTFFDWEWIYGIGCTPDDTECPEVDFTLPFLVVDVPTQVSSLLSQGFAQPLAMKNEG